MSAQGAGLARGGQGSGDDGDEVGPRGSTGSMLSASTRKARPQTVNSTITDPQHRGAAQPPGGTSQVLMGFKGVQGLGFWGGGGGGGGGGDSTCHLKH